MSNFMTIVQYRVSKVKSWVGPMILKFSVKELFFEYLFWLMLRTTVWGHYAHLSDVFSYKPLTKLYWMTITHYILSKIVYIVYIHKKDAHSCQLSTFVWGTLNVMIVSANQVRILQLMEEPIKTLDFYLFQQFLFYNRKTKNYQGCYNSIFYYLLWCIDA